ncbi:MAG: alpha/beta hydrolase [Deltaproteobacteria bacterium]|nr:alpha/beta hydrolase [Deltaproteobacteria bacterium]
MVLCPGIGCDQYAWKYLLPYFQDQYTIVRWNYRGHGKSATPADPARLSMNDVRRDLDALVAHLGIDKAMLVGHSMGVQVVLDYFVHHKDKVAGLVAICGSYGTPMKTFHDSNVGDRVLPYLNAALARFPRGARALWKTILKGSLAFEIAARTEVNGDFVLKEDFLPYFEHLRSMDPLIFFRMLAELNRHDVYEHLQDIDTPTLIVAGERDTFTPAHLSKTMHERIPGSELLFIPGGSHTAPIEFPELLNLRIEKFLRERLPKAF